MEICPCDNLKALDEISRTAELMNCYLKMSMIDAPKASISIKFFQW